MLCQLFADGKCHVRNRDKALISIRPRRHIHIHIYQALQMVRIITRPNSSDTRASHSAYTNFLNGYFTLDNRNAESVLTITIYLSNQLILLFLSLQNSLTLQLKDIPTQQRYSTWGTATREENYHQSRSLPIRRLETLSYLQMRVRN